MSKHKVQRNLSIESLFASVEKLDNAEVEAELRAHHIDPGVAGSVVKNAIDRALADHLPVPRSVRSDNRGTPNVRMFRDSEQSVFGGRSTSLPSDRKDKKDND